MKNNNNKFLVICLMGCFILFTITFFLKAADKLELEIQTDKTKFLLAEPIVLIVSLKNLDTKPIKVMQFLEPDFGFVDYLVTGPDGNQSKFVPWALKEHPSPQVDLAAGDTLSVEAKIFFGGDEWTFSKPGRYEIQAIYMDNLPSNKLNITVVSAADDPARKAGDLFIKSKEVGYFLLFEGGDHLKEGKQRLEEVSNQFPDTPHAIYANFALGANLMVDFADFKNNRLRKADPGQAVKFLEKARVRSVNFYQALHTHLFLSEGYKKIGQMQKATDVQTELETITRENFPMFQKHLNYIFKKKKIK